MPRKPSVSLKLVHHKASGRAKVRIHGHDVWLGKWGTPEAEERHRRVIAEYAATGAPPAPSAKFAPLTVAELVAEYRRFAEGYYLKNGEPTSELHAVKDTLRLLREHYGLTPAADFSPLKLKAVRDVMIGRGWCRKSINQRVGRIKRLFAWAVENEMVPPSVHHGLTAVPGLRRGRSAAKESKPVLPADEAAVNAALPHLTPQIRDMVRLQLLTGCRPGEICIVRPCDVHRDGESWEYRPATHKTEHHGRQRRIYLGPRAQAVLTPWLDNRPAEDWCFKPSEAQAAWRNANYANRGSRAGRKKGAGTHQARDVYDVRSYGNAIKRACKRAGVSHFAPNQLRHAAATMIRRDYGIEAAQAILGHSDCVITQVYAERDFAAACRVMAEIG